MQRFYLGVDASKGYADFVILDANKVIVQRNFQLDDTFHGHCCLTERLRLFFKKHPDAELYAAIESTGGYEKNWLNTLGTCRWVWNVRTARVHPLSVSHNLKADLKRNITDKISAQSVAEYLIAHPEKVRYKTDDPQAALRRQWHFINTLTKQKTQLLNQLQTLIYTANTELCSYCKDGMPQWLLKLLERYPTARKLARGRVATVARIPYLSRDKAKKLIEMAKTSIAADSDPITENTISMMAKQINALGKSIDAQATIVEKHASIPEVNLLKTFKGIGSFTAIGLMLEIRSVKLYASSKKLAAFFGLHPIYKISGDGQGCFRMSKRGRKEPRRLLFMVAMSATESNPLIRKLYLRKRGEGMTRMAAIGVCMHKILRILYGMLKHNRPFDAQVDIQNTKATRKRWDKTRIAKSRRYQDYDPNAPISRRQKAKRMERKRSQSVSNTKRGIQTPVPLDSLAN